MLLGHQININCTGVLGSQAINSRSRWKTGDSSRKPSEIQFTY